MSKKYFMAMLFVSVTLLSGCTILLWGFNKPVDGGHLEIVKSYTDEIQSAFEYKNVRMNTQASSGSDANISLPSEGVGFIGKKNVYFVTMNGDVLLSLNTLMKTIPLESVSDSKYIDINLTSNYQGYGNAAFNQFINIKTRKAASSLTDVQISTLKSSSFILHDGYYQRTIEIKGVIINKERFAAGIPDELPLNDSYHVRFFKNRHVSDVNGGKLAFNLLMTPVTLVGDIILIPVYLFSAIK